MNEATLTNAKDACGRSKTRDGRGKKGAVNGGIKAQKQQLGEGKKHTAGAHVGEEELRREGKNGDEELERRLVKGWLKKVSESFKGE